MTKQIIRRKAYVDTKYCVACGVCEKTSDIISYKAGYNKNKTVVSFVFTQNCLLSYILI